MGPQGPVGPVGTILGSYNTLAELETAHPDGNQGDAYLVDGILYIWDTEEEGWTSTGGNLQGPVGPVELQFSSITGARLQTGGSGERAQLAAVGLGFDEVASTSDPIILDQPAISIKTFTGGTITDISVALSIVLGSADATGATVYAQLYTASTFASREYAPVPGTQVTFTIPWGDPIGSFYQDSLTGLSIEIEPETQLVLGFYAESGAVTWGINAHLSGVVKMKG